MESFKGLQLVIWGSIIRYKVYAFVSCKVNIFVQISSQFEFKFWKGSATILSRKAIRTPPPWTFLTFLMAS